MMIAILLLQLVNLLFILDIWRTMRAITKDPPSKPEH